MVRAWPDTGCRSGEQSGADGGLHQFWIREAPVAGHRVDQVVADPDVERAVDERNELDRRELLAELDHQGAREVGGRGLVAALRAVRDADAHGGHAAAGERSTISRRARMTSRLAHATSASRRSVISAVSRARTSSGRASGDEPYGPYSGCSAWICLRCSARRSVTLAGRSVNTPSSLNLSSKNANTGIDSNFPWFRYRCMRSLF